MSAIILRTFSFFESKPSARRATCSSLVSIVPEPSVSNFEKDDYRQLFTSKLQLMLCLFTLQLQPTTYEHLLKSHYFHMCSLLGNCWIKALFVPLYGSTLAT